MGSEDAANATDRHPVSVNYWFNTSADAVRIWTVNNSGTNEVFATYSTTGIYPDGELSKTVSVNEHGKQVVEFKDKEGMALLKKVQLTALADNGAGTGYTDWLCTYYIYDAFNRLRAVVQPAPCQTSR